MEYYYNSGQSSFDNVLHHVCTKYAKNSAENLLNGLVYIVQVHVPMHTDNMILRIFSLRQDFLAKWNQSESILSIKYLNKKT